MKKRGLLTLLVFTITIIHLFATDPTDNKSTNSGKHDQDGIFYNASITNLLKNPKFENGPSYWTLGKYNGTAATFSTDSQSGNFQAVVSTSGSINKEYEDIQLFNFLEISKNTKYTITFKAKVKTASLIAISVGNGINTFFDEKMLLRPDQSIYGPFTFKSNADEAFAFFAFNLGKTQGNLTFDDVVITADNTEKQFEKILSSGGINIYPVSQGQELYLQLPTVAKTEYPVIFMNDEGKTVKTDKIRQGEQESTIRLNEKLASGNYIVKVFTPEKTMAYNFQIQE